MSGSIPPGNPALLEAIREEIERSGPIPFERFMERALYHPEHGYYTAGSERLGKGGDFFTASDVGDLFGGCLARQLDEVDALLGRPESFSVLEFGAGRGLLARDIMAAVSGDFPDMAARLSYTMVDRSAGMRAEAVTQAPGAKAAGYDDLEPGAAGCAVAVELFDALPVRRVRRIEGRLREIFVGLGEDRELVEVDSDPEEMTARLAERYGAAAEEGSEAELCPGIDSMFGRIDGALERGVALLVDYGHPAHELYAPIRRRGTLLAYHRHKTSEDYLRRVGEQDLTAHVNFTAVEDRARELGWSVLGLTTQDRFLIANGILERFESADEAEYGDPARVKGRLRAMQLIHPQGMGRTFRVLALSKGIDPVPALRGLNDPFAR